MLNDLLTGAPTPGAAAWAAATPITDPAAMQEALKTIVRDAPKEAISKLSDADLSAAARMFGQQTTKQGAVLMLLLDQHEHLGQSIAYARSNSVVPPWSK